MRRVFHYLIPLLSLFAICGMLRVLEASTTLSGLVTIPSPTMVMPGPIVSGQALRIGEAISNTFDPRVSGLVRPVGSMAYTRDGSTAYLKTGTTQAAWELLGPGSQMGGVGRDGGLNARALALVGFPPSTFTCNHDDFDRLPASPVYNLFGLGSGTSSAATTTSLIGMWSDVNTGAAASSTEILYGSSPTLGRPDTTKFYIAARFAITTAIDAQATATVTLGIGTGATFNPQMGIGVCGNGSTAFYTTYYDGLSTVCGGTRAVSTVAFVASVAHIFELWGIGDGKLHSAIDLSETSGSPFTMASSPTQSQRAGAYVTNGTTAAARTLEIDWWHLCWSET